MATEKSTTRSYRSPLRDEQARLTRRRILDAARPLLIERGYAATTVELLASEAGVSVQTVYNTIGGKAAVIKAVYDVVLAGDDDPIPIAERPAFAAMLAEQDGRAFLRRYAALGREISERVGPLLVVLLAQAASGDSSLDEFVATVEQERLAAAVGIAAVAADRFGLRDGLDEAHAADAIWVLTSAEVYDRLVNRRGWSLDEYETWLADSLATILPATPELA